MKSKTKLILSLCVILACALFTTACDLGGGPSTNDISAEKTEITSYLSSGWALFSDDEVKDYLSRYEAIRKDVQSATTKDALEDCKKRFDSLKNDIQKDIEYRAAYLSKPTALSDMKTIFIKSVDDTWTELKNTYGTAVSSFENSVTTLKQAANAAPDESALSECVTTWIATLSTLKTTAGIEVSLNFDGVKVQVLTDTAIAWQGKTDDNDLTGALSTYFSVKYAKISASMNNAATQADLDKLKADFNALTEEYDNALESGDVTDVETMKIVVFYAMTEAWEELTETYGESKLNAFYDEYLSMRCNVKTINAMSGVETCISDFSDFLNKINEKLNNSTSSFSDYKEKTCSTVEDEWIRLLKNADLIITDDQKSQYAEILRKIEAATDKEAIEKALGEFNALTEKIRESSTPEGLKTYKGEIKSKLSESWNGILNNYSDKVTEAHKSAFNKLLADIDEAESKIEIDQLANSFNSLIAEIVPPTPPTPTDFATYKANAKAEIEAEWEIATDADKDDPDYNISDIQKAYYQEILRFLDSATEQEQVDRASYEFGELSQHLGNPDNDEYDLGYYRERVKTNIQKEWDALQQTVNVPHNHMTTWFDLHQRMESDKNFSDLLSLRTEFDALVKAIKDDETARLGLFEYINSAKSQIESEWSELSANYDVNSFKGTYENLLQQLQSCQDNDIDQFINGYVTAETIKAKVNEIKTDFAALKENVINYNGQSQDIEDKKKAALSTIKAEWAALSSYDLSPYKASYEAIIEKVESANTEHDVASELQAFETLVQQIKNSQGSGTGSETDLKNYKDTVMQLIAASWNNLLETYPSLSSSDEVKSYQSIKEAIEGADNKTDVAAALSQFNALVETVKNTYEEKDFDAYKQTVQSSVEEYWKAVEIGFEVTGTTLQYDYQELINKLYLAETSAEVTEYKDRFFNSILNGVKDLTPKSVLSYSEYAIELLNLKWDDIDEQYESGKKEYFFEFSALSDKIKEAGCDEGKGITVITELLNQYPDLEAKVKNYVGISSAKLTKSLLSATVGTKLNDFLTKEVLSQKITVTKSNGTTEEVAITKDMVNADKVDFSKVGEYSLTVKYASNYYTVKVSVTPDLSEATVVESGSIGEKSTLSSLMRFEGRFTIYSNGYIELFSNKEDSAFYKLYYSCEVLSAYTDTSVGVYKVTYTENRVLVISVKADADGAIAEFYQPSGEIKFNGTYPVTHGGSQENLAINIYEDFNANDVYIATMNVDGFGSLLVTTLVTLKDTEITCSFFPEFSLGLVSTVTSNGEIADEELVFGIYSISFDNQTIDYDYVKMGETVKNRFTEILETTKTVYGVKITETVTVHDTFKNWYNQSILEQLNDEYNCNVYNLGEIIRSFDEMISAMKSKCQLVNKFNAEWQALQNNPKIEAFKTGYGFALQSLATDYGVGSNTDYDAMDSKYKAFIEMIKNNYVAKYYLKNNDSTSLSFNVTDGDSIKDFVNEYLAGRTLVIEYSAYDFETVNSFMGTWDFELYNIKEERQITQDMIQGIDLNGTFSSENSNIQFGIVVENDTGCDLSDNPMYVTPSPIYVTVTVMLSGSMGT